QADDLPAELDGWVRTNFESQERDSSSAFGEHSRIWTYERGRSVVRLSLDFVFPEWHGLTACYQGAGWKLNSQSRVEKGATRVEALFSKPEGDHAYLLFDLFDSQGKPYVSPAGSLLHPQLRRILHGEATRFTLPSYYQVQLLAGVPGGELSAEDRESLQQLLKRFEEHMKLKFAF
ncbi:MAG: exosortase U, partial [Planctomycetaceae bacterium]|nr:exosortase U [Planctomycetaceae bacterium]